MPALNWIAMENGIESDPKLLSFARLLKAKHELAFWYLYMWRVLVLQKGNHVTGTLPKKYTAQDLASFVGFKGDPRRFVNAMKKSGFLGFRKGCGFLYPGWRDTTTGGYAAHRQEDRDRKAKDRPGRMLRPSPTSAPRDPLGPVSEVPRNVRGQLLEIPRNFQGNQEERNEESEVGRPPEPPHAGGDLADARWEWLSQHALTVQNREVCKKILAVMSESDWGLVQRGYSLAVEGASISKRDLRVLRWPTDRFLRQQAYLRFGVPDRPRRRPRSGAEAAPPVSPADELKQRLCQIDGFVTDLLGDPDQPEHAKADAKRRWEEIPENTDRTPPWSAPQAGQSLNGTGR